MGFRPKPAERIVQRRYSHRSPYQRSTPLSQLSKCSSSGMHTPVSQTLKMSMDSIKSRLAGTGSDSPLSLSPKTSNETRYAGTSTPRDVVNLSNCQKEWATVLRKS